METTRGRKIRVHYTTAVAVLFLIVVVVLGGALLLLKKETKNLQKISSSPAANEQSIKPTQGMPFYTKDQDKLNICQMKDEDKKVSSYFLTQKDGLVVGSVAGIVNLVNQDATHTKGNIVINSQQDLVPHVFAFPITSKIIYDQVDKKDATYDDLKSNQSVVITFNCDPKNNGAVTVTNIAITKKS